MNPYLLGVDVGTTRTAAAIGRPGRAPEAVPLGEPYPGGVGDAEQYAVAVRWVVDRVAEREGGPAARIAVTHPAAWDDHQQGLVAEALRGQGVTATLLAEPEAAALHYAANERLHPGAILAVYDWDGGRFDAAVVQRDTSGFSLLGRPEGVEDLGGVDVDQAVFEETMTALRRAIGSAGTTPEALAAVLLVGGSARIPLVGQLVSQELGRPVAVDAEPEHAVAKGAVAALGATGNGAMAVQGTGDFATPPTGTGRYPSEAPTAYAPLGAETPTTYSPAPDPYADPGYGLFSGPNSDARTEALPTDTQHTRFASAPPGHLFESYAEVDSERPQGRSPVLVVGAGGLVAALAVIGAVAFWPEGPSAGNASNRVDTSAIAPPPEAPVATLPPIAEETTEVPTRRTVAPTRTRVTVSPTPDPIIPPPVEPSIPDEPTPPTTTTSSDPGPGPDPTVSAEPTPTILPTAAPNQRAPR